MNKLRRYAYLTLFSLIGALWFWVTSATPSQAHWADMAAAEVTVDRAEAQITLTFPTGLTAFADDNRDQRLSLEEVRAHTAGLEDFLSQKIRLTDQENRSGTLSVKPLLGTLPPTVQIAPGSHSTLQLIYNWPEPVQGLKIHYNLFLPGVPTASCLTTLLQAGHLKTFVFTPKQQTLAFTPGFAGSNAGELIFAIAGALIWGALHSMSPGHGKTIVGAYLVGERATPRHAMFLALTTTITHTIGVFALGLVTLFAAQYILPEQLYPWLSLISGVMVVVIGLNLFRDRIKRTRQNRSQVHSHHHHEHHHLQSHDHSHDHLHNHSHHPHTHLPSDDAPITWRSLIALGISGGLVPCPAALVLLLSAIALGNVTLGLTLVLAFSLGLAGVLTGLGLLLVYAKHLFKQIPTQIRWVKMLPAVSAVCITLIGIGISTKAVIQVLNF